MAEVILRLRIECKILRTDRGELPVLGKIELALGAREIVALVGPSGCGKTTLLRIVGGLDTDFQGSLDWRGAVTAAHRHGFPGATPAAVAHRASERAAGTTDRKP